MEYVRPELTIKKFKKEEIRTTDLIQISGTSTGSSNEPWTDAGGEWN